MNNFLHFVVSHPVFSSLVDNLHFKFHYSIDEMMKILNINANLSSFSHIFLEFLSFKLCLKMSYSQQKNYLQ